MKENRYWSTYVQSTEELYTSRSLKFTEENLHRWIEAMGVKDGMRLLEVGCAGGLLSHRIKTRLPGCEITGVDLDAGHIEFAKAKTAELGLTGTFVTGDACGLPFADDLFDLTFSHTVMSFCDPDRFAAEQYRVLKPGGRMAVLEVVNSVPGPEEWVPTPDCEEYELFDRLWEAASENDNSNVKKFETDPRRYALYLERQGFKNLSIDAVANVKYAPGWANMPEEAALAQINDDRLSELTSAAKAHAMAPAALTDSEYESLLQMIHRRYDAQVAAYKRGERSRDFRIATTVVITGEKI